MIKSRTPKRETNPPRIDLNNFVSIMRDVVPKLDKLEGGWTASRRRKNRSKKVKIIHLLRESDRRHA